MTPSRKLKEVTEQIRAFLWQLDRIMSQPSTVERGQKVAQLANELALYNDGVRYGHCGVDFRRDRPCKAGEPMTPSAEALRQLMEKWELERLAYLDGVMRGHDPAVCGMNRASAETCRRFLADLEAVAAGLVDPTGAR